MPKAKKNPTDKKVACAFQGGGALGAYQVGIVHALDEAGYSPHWFIGTSIGAINAAIAAGNPEKIRVEKMHQFWASVATPSVPNPYPILDDPISRKIQHLFSANATLFVGQPGFFHPRFPPPEFGWEDKASSLSYYDTSQLKNTLEQYIDFDRINEGSVRLSIGAVEICSGKMVYFDTTKQKIGPEHIMASGALPPGFPAVEVEGKLYWDGGISSNSPGTYVLSSQRCPQDLLLFTVHLFDSYGLNPTTIDEVLKRKKDIEFSSRFSKMLHLYQEIHSLKNSIHILSQKIAKDEPLTDEVKSCIQKGRESTISIVRFLSEVDDTELSSKDYEFSIKTIKERIAQGYKDGKKAIKKSPWLAPVPATQGLAIYDMATNKHMEDLNDE